MLDVAKIFVSFIAGYLLGSLNTSVLVGQIYGKDIRHYGSKNAGLTNTLRVLGKSAAAVVLAGDILKGIAACIIGLRLGVDVHTGATTDCISLLAAGAGAVIGHNWPVYFGFKGGKGALTAIAVLFTFDWAMALMCLGLFAGSSPRPAMSPWAQFALPCSLLSFHSCRSSGTPLTFISLLA